MFSIETQGAVDVIIPGVALNHESAEMLRDTVASISLEGQPMVVVDLSHVPLVDSAGLEALVDIQQAMQASGGTVKLAAPTQLCEDIFRVSGLAQRFEVYTDAKAAVRSYVR